MEIELRFHVCFLVINRFCKGYREFTSLYSYISMLDFLGKDVNFVSLILSSTQQSTYLLQNQCQTVVDCNLQGNKL
jgi:hypothetical protein